MAPHAQLPGPRGAPHSCEEQGNRGGGPRAHRQVQTECGFQPGGELPARDGMRWKRLRARRAPEQRRRPLARPLRRRSWQIQFLGARAELPRSPQHACFEARGEGGGGAEEEGRPAPRRTRRALHAPAEGKGRTPRLGGCGELAGGQREGGAAGWLSKSAAPRKRLEPSDRSHQAPRVVSGDSNSFSGRRRDIRRRRRPPAPGCPWMPLDARHPWYRVDNYDIIVTICFFDKYDRPKSFVDN